MRAAKQTTPPVSAHATAIRCSHVSGAVLRNHHGVVSTAPLRAIGLTDRTGL